MKNRPPANEPFQAAMSLASANELAARLLRREGVEGAARDARMLVAQAAGVTAVSLIADPQRPLGEEAARRLTDMVARRAAREPVSRIFGQREFYGRPFRITPDTLDPRPDSETLIDAALELGESEGWRDREITILDVGTGSGCLIVTLLAEWPRARGVATDISASALAVALSNAERLGVASRLRLRRMDALQEFDGRFDLIVSNPPYIPSADIIGLEADVRDFDPGTALDGGPDGLAFYRRFARIVSAHLTGAPRPGWFLCEIGAGQDPEVGRLFSPARFDSPKRYLDLNGHTRCVAWQPRH